ncbi:MAG: protein translocase subunit SecF [Candidatus Peregrinibacteria bacterium]
MRFSILSKTRIWFSFSILLSLVSLFFLFAPGFGLPLGIDFTGGTELEISFVNTTPPKEKMTEIFDTAVGADRGLKVIEEQGGRTFLLRSHLVSPVEQVKLLEAIKTQNFVPTLERVSSVGPTLGVYFKKQAFWAISVTILAIVSFVAWAFRSVPQGISSWKFGMATVVALLHDVLLISGFFAVLGRFIDIEVDSLFVTAVLTVLGFSVHDTIVVFDRLRENLKGKKVKDFSLLAENSLWQTMGRSLHTSTSAVLVLVALLIMGPSSIFAFVLALAFGIVVGTYSSILIAVPLLVIWQKDAHIGSLD